MIQDTNWFWIILGSAWLLGLVVSVIMVFMSKDNNRFHKPRSFSQAVIFGYILVSSTLLLPQSGFSGLLQLGVLGYSIIILFVCLYLFFNPTVLYGVAFSGNMIQVPVMEVPLELQQEIKVKEEIIDIKEVKEKMPSSAPRASLTMEQSNNYRKLIKEHFADSLAFRKPGYATRDLSNETGIPGYLVSLFIKQEYGMNFNEFVNANRVEYLAGLLKTSFNCESYTLEAIGKMAGFNSRSAFIAAIKKYTGMTPSTFFGRRDSEAKECPIFNFPERMRDVA